MTTLTLAAAAAESSDLNWPGALVICVVIVAFAYIMGKMLG